VQTSRAEFERAGCPNIRLLSPFREGAVNDWKLVEPSLQRKALRYHEIYRIRNKILRQFLQYFATLRKPRKKLAALREIAEMEFRFTEKDRLKERRALFDKHKDWKLPLEPNTKCIVCNNTAQLRHHIVQLRNGGTNGHLNLIPLCVPCHEEIHPWMKQLRLQHSSY
jgi:hypothetical protein